MTSGVSCLITGAAGFVGANLARRLIREGAQVHLLTRPGSDLWRLKGLEDRVLSVDLLDREALTRALERSHPERVYHLAAHGAYPGQKDANLILETNLLGTYGLLEACLRSPCKLFVQSGSSSEYGWKKEPMRETDRLEPNSFYSIGKAAATHLGSFFSLSSPFSVVTLRLFSVYGWQEEPSRLIPTLIHKALKNEPLDLVSPQIARDFVHVEDVLDAFLDTKALLAHNGEVFNIGTGVQSTIGEAVRIVMELTGSRSELRWGTMKPRDWDSFCWVASMEKTHEKLGWKARTSLSKGLEFTLQRIKEAP